MRHQALASRIGRHQQHDPEGSHYSLSFVIPLDFRLCHLSLSGVLGLIWHLSFVIGLVFGFWHLKFGMMPHLPFSGIFSYNSDRIVK